MTEEKGIYIATLYGNEKRTERINMKVRPSIKRIAEANAEADGRTLSNYIEKLIKDDAKRRAQD